MDRLTGFEVFLAIVDNGGFSRAAERLGMSPAMVSTHLARLEDRLGTRLIDRSTRRFALTLEGHRFLHDARAILDAVTEAENGVRRGAHQPKGWLRIDAPGAIGMRLIVPAIEPLRRLYPEVAVDLSFGEHRSEMQAEGIDIIIRVGTPPPDRGVNMVLGKTRFVQVASPDYIARMGVPATLEELTQHDMIVYATSERPLGQRWRFEKEGEMRWVRPQAAAAFNHGDAIAAAAVAGVGIAQTLEVLVAPEIRAGALVPVLADWNPAAADIHLFMPRDRAKRPAVSRVAEYLAQHVDWTSGG